LTHSKGDWRMSWRAQSRSKDAKTPSAALAMPRKPKLALCGIQRYYVPSLLAGSPILMLESTITHITQPPRPSPIHGCNPKVCVRPGSGHRAVLSNLVRCCSAFAHTTTAPTSLDLRCSALGLEPRASHNGQVVGSGQAAAAPIHRIRPTSAAPRFGILQRNLCVPAAGTALRAYYLLPPHASSRAS
jgi:hypothetical protein